MYLSPSLQEVSLLFLHDLHGPPDIAAGHADSEDQLGLAGGADEIDLGFAITEHVDMRRLVIVDEDDEAQAVSAVHGDHCRT
jgi:hypothetical protein